MKVFILTRENIHGQVQVINAHDSLDKAMNQELVMDYKFAQGGANWWNTTESLVEDYMAWYSITELEVL